MSRAIACLNASIVIFLFSLLVHFNGEARGKARKHYAKKNYVKNYYRFHFHSLKINVVYVRQKTVKFVFVVLPFVFEVLRFIRLERLVSPGKHLVVIIYKPLKRRAVLEPFAFPDSLAERVPINLNFNLTFNVVFDCRVSLQKSG